MYNIYQEKGIYMNKKTVFKRSIITIFGISFVVYIIFLLSPLFVNPILKSYIPQIKDEISKSTRLVVNFDEINFKTTPKMTIGVDIKRFTVNLPDSKEVLSIDSLGVKLSLIPLLAKKIELDLISIDNINGTFEIDKNGEFDIEKYIMPASVETSEGGSSSTELEPLPYGIKLSNRMPDILINKYNLNVKDSYKNKNYTLAGVALHITQFILDKKIKIKGDGKIVLDGEEHFNFDVKVLNRIMPNLNLNDLVFASSTERSESIPEFNIGKTLISILESLHKNGITSNVVADVKTFGSTDDINIFGKINIQNIGLNVYGKPLPKGYLNLDFNKNKIVAKSQIFTSKEDSTTIDGNFRTGKHPNIDLSVKSGANLSDIVNVFDSILKSFNCSQLATLSAQGRLDSDFNLKSNLKKIESSGHIKIDKGKINYALYNVTINDIISDIDLSNNMISIKDTGFKILNQPLSVYGTVRENSNCDLHVIADKLQVKGLLLALGQAELLKENNISSGTVSADVAIEGKLNKLNPDININVDKINIANIPSDTNLSVDSVIVNIDTDGKTYLGNIDINSVLVKNPMAKVKIPESKITFGQNDIVIDKSTLFLNNSKIYLTGKITDYISDKIKFDIKANGDIISSDIKSMIPKELGLDVSAKGSMPLRVDITGNNKTQNIRANLTATPNGFVSIADIDKLSGHNTIINSNISISNNNIKLNDTGVFADSINNPVVKVSGGLSDLTGRQNLNSINIVTPQNISVSIPGFKGSKATLKADITANGKISNPLVKGTVTIPNATIPSMKLTLKDTSLTLNNKEINANSSSITMGESDFSGKAQISNNFNNGIILNTLEFSSKYIDSDELMNIISKLPQNSGSNSNGTVQSGDLGITIYNGKFDISKLKSGTIIAENITSPLSLKNNVAYLNNLNLKAYEGNLTGKATFNVINSNTTLDIKGSSMNAVKAIEAVAGIKNAISGKLGFTANLTLNAKDDKTMLKTAKGNVSFNIDEGTFLNIGTLQSFLNAQNILQNAILKAAVQSITYLPTIKNTANFKSLKGDLSLSNGWATLKSIKSQGNSLCYYITGTYNLLSAYSSILFLGRLDQDIVALLGPVGNLSVSKLTSYIPKFGALTGQLITAITSNPDREKTSEIPSLLSGSTNYKDFKVEMIGTLGTPTSIKSFKWLTVCDTSEITTLSIKEQVKTTKDAIKNEYKNQVQQVKNTVDATKQEVKNKVETVREEAKEQAQQTQNVKNNLKNIKNLQDLLKNNGASMGAGN